MLSGPEIARIIQEYNGIEEVQDNRHHEDSESFNKKFAAHVKELLVILEEKNIFGTSDLTSIGNDRVVINQTNNDRVLRAPQTANELYNDYIKERILTTTKSIHDTIKQNRFSTFNLKEKKAVSKDKIKLEQGKTYATDICKLLIAHEVRGGDSKDFFQYENCKFPPSISEFGELRQSSADEAFINRLEKNLSKDHSCNVRDSTCLIIDGEDLMCTFTSTKCKTFLEFSATINNYIEKLTTKYARIDLVFGCYGENSTHDRGSVLLVNDEFTFPKNWTSFLSNNFHKTQLSSYLAQKLMAKFKNSSTQIIVAAEEQVYKNNNAIDVEDISPCNHTDSASRVVLHAIHSSKTESVICIQTSKLVSVVLCV